MRVIAGLLLAVAGFSPAEADIGALTIRRWALTHAAPLGNTLEPVRRLIGNARVVAIGEPAHGAAEPLGLRNEIIQALVERHGFRAVALETGVTQARMIDTFTDCGAGDAAAVVRDGLSWGFGAFASNVELVSWLRAWNCRHRGQTVHFYGIDVQGGDAQGGMSMAGMAIDALVASLAAEGGGSADAKALAAYRATFAPEAFRNQSSERKAELAALLNRIERAINRNRKTEQGKRALQDLRAVRQLVALFSVWPRITIGKPLPAAFWRVSQMRDKAMADNLLEALTDMGAGGRIVVFAHDGHIGNALLGSPPGVAYPQLPEAMGVHLRRALGRQFRTIAILGTDGPSDLPPRKAMPGTVELGLDGVAPVPFLVDLRAAPAWTRQPQTINSNYIETTRLVPATAYDGLIFAGQLTRAAVASSSR